MLTYTEMPWENQLRRAKVEFLKVGVDYLEKKIITCNYECTGIWKNEKVISGLVYQLVYNIMKKYLW